MILLYVFSFILLSCSQRNTHDDLDQALRVSNLKSVVEEPYRDVMFFKGEGLEVWARSNTGLATRPTSISTMLYVVDRGKVIYSSQAFAINEPNLGPAVWIDARGRILLLHHTWPDSASTSSIAYQARIVALTPKLAQIIFKEEFVAVTVDTSGDPQYGYYGWIRTVDGLPTVGKIVAPVPRQIGQVGVWKLEKAYHQSGNGVFEEIH